ncbi:MAG: NmrA/HSCARG family protein, partial [Betaproteobacteria bacterium]
IADAAVIELLRRDRAPAALPRATYELSGPDALTGTSLANVWSGALDREVRYAGGDLDAFEKAVKTKAPAWLAYDLRAMMRRYQADGAVATPDDLVRLTTLLGRPPRSYRDFAREMARSWQA